MRFRRALNNSGGWVFIDIVMGLLLLGIIGAMLGTAAAWHQRSLAHLSDTRAASRIAESAFVSLQAGQHPDRSTFHCREISAAGDLSAMTWVEVTASVNGRSASLVGLVPKTSLPIGGGS